MVEKVDGSAMPSGAGVSPSGTPSTPQTECDDSTRICTISGLSTDNTAYGSYDVQIHASIASATVTGSAADETSIKFQITIQRFPVCDFVDPAVNAIVPVTDCSKYLCPDDFTIYTTDEWGFTFFDNWNDTYTQQCKGIGGYYTKDGGTTWINVNTFSNNPVLAIIGPQYNVFPSYTLVDAVSLTKIESFVFDKGDITIAFDSDYEGRKKYAIGARTLNKKLVGEHRVKVQVRRTAKSAAFYTNSFVITVIDPCSPVVCSKVSFYPERFETLDDILLTVNEPLVQTESSYWTSNHAGWCGDKQVWFACGSPKFYLYDADTNLPITDF